MNTNVCYTFSEEMEFSLVFTCRACSYMLDIMHHIPLSKIADVIDMVIHTHPCPNCPEGSINFRFCNICSPHLYHFINGLCFRVMNNGLYLREAFTDPCSLNICTCDRFIDDVILVSYGRLWPFICAHCSKFWLHEELQERKDLQFGYLRSMQINIFTHTFKGAHLDFTDNINYPKLDCINKFRVAHNILIRGLSLDNKNAPQP